MPPPDPSRCIAFMHIPKTAGTSVVKAFERKLGAEACHQKSAAVTDADFTTHRFISGHHTLAAITPNAWRFTFLRDPVAQLASHIRWLDHYNEPRMRQQAQQLPPPMRHIVVRVGQTDFGSAAEIDALFEWLPENAPAVLSNVQSKVLSRRPGIRTFADVADLAKAAIFNLQYLNFIGLTEQLEGDMARLFRRIGLDGKPDIRHDNTRSSPRSFDLADPTIRAVLERRMQADIRLYDHVLRRRRAIVVKW